LLIKHFKGVNTKYMPRKKRTIIDESIPDNAITTEAGEQIILGDGSGDSDLDALLAGFGASPFKIKVYRVTTFGSTFCFQTTEPIDESYIQSLHGGGKYAIRVYRENVLVKTIYYDIETKPVTNTPNGNGGNSYMNDVATMQINMLRDQLATFQQMVMAFIGRPNPIQQATPMSEVVAAMQVMHGMRPAGTDPVDLIIKGMELGSKGGNASPDWKSELIHTAKEVLAPVAGVLAQQAIKPPMNVNQPQLPEGQLNMQTAPQSLPNNMMVRQGISMLKGQIMNGLEPEVACDWLLQNANLPMYQPFFVIAIQSGVDAFIQIDPEIANEPYKSWFIKTITLVREAYNESISGHSADISGGIGHGTNTTNNETVSTTPRTEIQAVK
jgi:hypothetical protein